MTARDLAVREVKQRVDEAVELDGDALVIFHVIGSSVALKRDDGRVVLASVERVRRAWLAQEQSRRDGET